MSDQVRQLFASFDALPEPDKQVAVAEILRRVPYDGDVPLDARHAAADELFSALDAEAAARAGR